MPKRTKLKERKRLTNAFVRKVTAPGKYYDRYLGLMLQVFPSGAKCWQQCIMFRGIRRTLGLGGFPVVTLAMAREAALENKRLTQSGEDPLLARRGVSAPTFAEAAAIVLEIHRPDWSNPKEEQNWTSSLERYVFPKLGSMLVSDIRPRDVLEVLRPIWHTKHRTAQKIRTRIGTIMRWAMSEGYRDNNPAGEAIAGGLPRAKKTKHHLAVPYADVAGVLTKVRQSNSILATKLAFEYLVLTAARSSEVRGARWEEISLAKALWTIPAERMKTRTEHRVPLSRKAIAILKEARELSSTGSGLVFPTSNGRELTVATLSVMLRRLQIPAVPHGFRSSFRDWCAEAGVAREIAELCLSHFVGTTVEQAYWRTDVLELRRNVMEAWADYLFLESCKDPSTRYTAQAVDRSNLGQESAPPNQRTPDPVRSTQGDLLQELLAAGDD